MIFKLNILVLENQNISEPEASLEKQGFAPVTFTISTAHGTGLGAEQHSTNPWRVR